MRTNEIGKSSIVLRECKDEYKEFQENTIGAAFLTKQLVVGSDIVKLEIWDTAGQERYHSLTPMYYRGSNAAVIVFDITSEATFNQAKKWVDELKQARNEAMIFIVGNKVDLDSTRTVQKQLVEEYCKTNNFNYFETSAKDNIGIHELFDAIAKQLPRTGAAEDDENVSVGDDIKTEKKSCC